ncbi:hypothetical protein [Zavarzinia aquatilis]|uniref:DUF4282 domain-containing protein n=1 Tax=Zavarzinia aquatilis TaxID=2211142 RepID=A0A317EKU2_9PROT|nr:hypothetical protein [Zavarzinia aquatilis]PWR25815.1 hypothetical protein DKG74_02345 [Zavarzinia aquatilis]
MQSYGLMVHRSKLMYGLGGIMKRLFLLSGPVGLTIVRLSYWAGISLLVMCSVTIWHNNISVQDVTEMDYAKAAILAGGVFVFGVIFLRCLAEIIITVMEVRDKLGAIERNTLTR